MQRLSLVFRDGCIEGQGRDWVGRFLFEGRYSVKDGKCVLWKRYLGAHEVLYSGWNEGARLWLWGTWEIVGQDRGGFHLWPEGQQDPTGLSLEQEVDQPVEEQILV